MSATTTATDEIGDKLEELQQLVREQLEDAAEPRATVLRCIDQDLSRVPTRSVKVLHDIDAGRKFGGAPV